MVLPKQPWTCGALFYMPHVIFVQKMPFQQVNDLKSILILVGALILPFTGTFIGLISVSKGLKWYRDLTKPDFTAPCWVLGPAWGISYGAMGVASYLVYRQVNGDVEVVSPLIVYLIHLFINWSWIPVFFGFQLIKAVNSPLSSILLPQTSSFQDAFILFFSPLE